MHAAFHNQRRNEAEQWSAAETAYQLARQVLYLAREHRTLVDQDELENDSRTDITSNVTRNDVSVKVSDTLDGAQAATMVVEAEAEAEATCAGGCLLRDCRGCDGGSTLR